MVGWTHVGFGGPRPGEEGELPIAMAAHSWATRKLFVIDSDLPALVLRSRGS